MAGLIKSLNITDAILSGFTVYISVSHKHTLLVSCNRHYIFAWHSMLKIAGINCVYVITGAHEGR